MQRNKRVDNVVSSQWRMQVETQYFASPEEVCAIYSGYNWHVVIAFVASPEVVSAIYPSYNQRAFIAFVACETQNFASLLYMLRIFCTVFFGHHIVCRTFCICILCAFAV